MRASFPALYLYPLNANSFVKHINLTNNQGVKIGRQTTVPAENNGSFDSAEVSRQHAEVWEEGGKIVIKDVRSLNGTFINKKRLSPGGLESKPYELKSYDIVEFGRKVAARVICVFSEHDALVAARAEQHQQHRLQQQQQQQQQHHAQQHGGPNQSAAPSSTSPFVRRPPTQLHGLGGMGSGSVFAEQDAIKREVGMGKRPILEPLNQDSDAMSKWRLYCNVVSVSYFAGKDAKQGKQNIDASMHACAILLEVNFKLEDRTLEYAMIPTCVVDKAIDVITFPDPYESFELSPRTIENTTVVAPSIQMPLGGGTLGSYTHKESKTVPVSLRIGKYIERYAEHIEIQWQFKNDGSRYFPSPIRLLIVVTKQSASSFAFKLRILNTLQVRLGPKKWRFFAREFKPAHSHGGWGFDINEDYNPGDAKEAFDQCQMGGSPNVGLHPLLDSHVNKG